MERMPTWDAHFSSRLRCTSPPSQTPRPTHMCHKACSPAAAAATPNSPSIEPDRALQFAPRPFATRSAASWFRTRADTHAETCRNARCTCRMTTDPKESNAEPPAVLGSSVNGNAKTATKPCPAPSTTSAW
eukprot:CAMPEP_0181218634 /NCGR_PEP_ID=MMETSP1096-20121128/27802_1 /TAXON_ID=156174 ORGANISM="Chrysochromulina ericina, Strain CCMP281" /NCGR_SAMPLE_ID=MMETSP1096 /ASSEMBLY_ACC=CAM_ASM_000453 /LENGTH=130 /DNA_ID=CAMNT_0023310871 /DNA_START=24 /DNA_END=413 /DNA_ORIENTATION=-